MSSNRWRVDRVGAEPESSHAYLRQPGRRRRSGSSAVNAAEAERRRLLWAQQKRSSLTGDGTGRLSKSAKQWSARRRPELNLLQAGSRRAADYVSKQCLSSVTGYRGEINEDTSVETSRRAGSRVLRIVARAKRKSESHAGSSGLKRRIQFLRIGRSRMAAGSACGLALESRPAQRPHAAPRRLHPHAGRDHPPDRQPEVELDASLRRPAGTANQPIACPRGKVWGRLQRSTG